MGDIADDHASQFYEGYDSWGANGDDGPSYVRLPVTCKHCGIGGFYWTETFNGWRLIRGGKIHVCTPDVTNLFDVIE